LLCLLTGYVILPALLTIFPPKFAKDTVGWDEMLGEPARGTQWNFLPPVIWLALLIAGLPFALRTGFNPSLIELQAPKLESVKLISKLETWSYAILSRDLETIRRAREQARVSPLVDRTESILIAYYNLEWLRAHESELAAVEWAEPDAVDASDLARLATKVKALKLDM
jgi:hypothetical protein